MSRDHPNATREAISITSSSEDDDDDDEDEFLFDKPPKFPMYLEREYVMTPEDEERSRKKQEKLWRDFVTTSIVYVSFLLSVMCATFIVKTLSYK